MRDNTVFDLGYWWVKLDDVFSAYKYLEEFVSDKQAISVHCNSIKYVHLDANNNLSYDVSGNIKKIFNQSRVSSIQDAFKIYSNQVLVVFTSITDSMINEFMLCLFLHNQKMFYQYLNNKDYEYLRKIDIKDIETLTDTKDIMRYQGIRIAKALNSGSIDKVFKRIEYICKINIDLSLKKSISSLYDRRNRIVHEIEDYEFNSKDIFNYYDNCDELRIILGKILHDNGAEIFDQAHWVITDHE